MKYVLVKRHTIVVSTNEFFPIHLCSSCLRNITCFYILVLHYANVVIIEQVLLIYLLYVVKLTQSPGFYHVRSVYQKN